MEEKQEKQENVRFLLVNEGKEEKEESFFFFLFPLCATAESIAINLAICKERAASKQPASNRISSIGHCDK